MTADWSKIEALPATTLTDLFAQDSERLSKLSLDVAGIHFDWSKTHLTTDMVAAFEQMAKAQDLAGKRQALFSARSSTSPRAARSSTPPSAARASPRASRSRRRATSGCAR